MGGDIAHVGVAGDIGAGGLVGGYDSGFGSNVVGDGGADDGNGGGCFLGSDDSGSGIAHDQINAVIDELGHDGGAVGGLAAGQFYVEAYLVAQLFGQSVLEALGGLVQSNVLHQLNNAYMVSAVIGLLGAAGAEAQKHQGDRDQCNNAFHSVGLLFSFLISQI